MARTGTDAQPEALQLPPARDSILLVIALLGVSMSGPLMAATAAPALAIAFWRNAMGAGFAVGTAAARNRAELVGMTRRGRLLAGGAGVALGAHFATWVPSVTMTSVASATALVATQTIFVAVIARFRGQRLPALAWTGIVVATVATGLITGADVGSSSRAITGDVLAVAGGFFAALYVTIGGQARRQMTAAAYTSICYTTSAVVLVVICLVGRVRLGGYSGDAWLKIVLVTVTAQLLGHSLINVVLRSTSPTVVSLAILFEVPGAALVAYVWLHQKPPLTAVPGLVLLLIGLVIVSRSRGAMAVEAVE